MVDDETVFETCLEYYNTDIKNEDITENNNATMSNKPIKNDSEKEEIQTKEKIVDFNKAKEEIGKKKEEKDQISMFDII